MADELKIQQIRSLLDSPIVNRANNLQPPDGMKSGLATGAAEGATPFADTLKQSIAEINHLQVQADRAIEDLAAGRSSNIQDTIMAVEKADISFKLMMEVRNKIISAYQEVMRTQV